jgi:hypothetical protein
LDGEEFTLLFPAGWRGEELLGEVVVVERVFVFDGVPDEVVPEEVLLFPAGDVVVLLLSVVVEVLVFTDELLLLSVLDEPTEVVPAGRADGVDVVVLLCRELTDGVDVDGVVLRVEIPPPRCACS